MRPLQRHLRSFFWVMILWAAAPLLFAQTPTFTSTNTPLPCGGSSSTFGFLSGSYTGPTTNVMRASAVTLSTPATVYAVSFYSYNPSAGAQACAAIYGGGPGAIGSMIVQSAPQTLSNFTTATFPVSATSLSPGTYWLAYMISGSTGVNTNSGVTTVQSTLSSSESVTFGTFPNSMAAPSYLSGDDFIYASYCPAATYTPTFTKTATPTSTSTYTFTVTDSFTSTNTPTSTFTPTVTNTGTLFSPTFTATNTPTITPTPTFTSSFTFTLTPNASLTPPCGASAGVFGIYPFSGNVSSSNPPNNGLRATRCNLSVPATVVSISLYAYDNPVAPPYPTDSGDLAQVAIYQDASDTLGALLVNSGAQTLTAGWNVFLIPTTTLSPGNYWLTYMFSAPVTFWESFDSNTSSGNSYCFPATPWGPFPPNGAVFVPLTYTTNRHGAIYANYCPAPTYTSTPSNTPTGSATYTPTVTNTLTLTNTPTGSSTATPTDTGTSTNTFTITNTGTNTFTPTDSPTDTWTGTSTYSPTVTNTGTNTNIPTITWTPTNTGTFTYSFTPTWTGTPTDSPTATATGTFTYTSSPTYSYTPSPTFTWTGTSTFISTATLTFTRTFTPTSSFTSTATLTFTNSPTGTLSPSATPTFTSTFTSTPTPSYTFTSSPTSSFTATASLTMTPTYTSTSTNTATFSATATFSSTATMTPTPGVDIVKSVSETTAQRGDVLTYSLTLAVTGNPVGAVTVTDVLPNYLDFIGFGTVPLGGSYSWDPATRTLGCVFPSLSVGSHMVSYQAQVDTSVPQGTILTNNAQLSYPGLLSPKAASVNVEVPLNVPVLYPNPIRDDAPANLQMIFGETERSVSIKVFTTAFRKVYEDTIQSVPQGLFTYGLDTTRFKGSRAANGLYYVVISTPSNRWVLKILVEK